MSWKEIVVYVCTTCSVLISLFALFKCLNLSRKINSVADFINGEIFSIRFQSMLSNYFSDEKNRRFVLEPMVPWLDEVLAKKTNESEERKVNEGVLFVD